MNRLQRFCPADSRWSLCRLAVALPALTALALILISLVPLARAQDAPTPTLDQVNAVSRELYCPLCNGVRLDTCELQACVQMRQVIADKLTAGVSKQQIKDEFVAQYGPVVLGEPPRQGLNLLGWVLPAAALVAGAAWLFYTARRWSRQPAPAPAAVGVDQPSPSEPCQALARAGDEYLSRVEADLADLD